MKYVILNTLRKEADYKYLSKKWMYNMGGDISMSLMCDDRVTFGSPYMASTTTSINNHDLLTYKTLAGAEKFYNNQLDSIVNFLTRDCVRISQKRKKHIESVKRTFKRVYKIVELSE